MIIKNVRAQIVGKNIKISAMCKIRKLGWDELYFTVNNKYKDFIFADASAFAAALLLPSMKQGENLIIKGSISQKLYNGMVASMAPMLHWGIGLKPITIKADRLTKDQQKPDAVGIFFSGGVDSFYSYLENKTSKDGNISHFILVNGYDIDLRNKDLWQKTLKQVSEIAAEEHIELIVIESNLHRLIAPILTWDNTYIGALAAVALLLRNKMKKVYRSSAYKDETDGGFLNTAIDRHLGTEKMSLVLYGDHASRVEKIKTIVRSKIVLNTLRVCYLNKKEAYNCGECEKCLRTMIALVAAKKLNQAKTFPDKINLAVVNTMIIPTQNTGIFHSENLEELKKLTLEPKLQRVLASRLQNIPKNRLSLSTEILNKIIYFDHVYNKGRIFTTISNGKKKF